MTPALATSESPRSGLAKERQECTSTAEAGSLGATAAEVNRAAAAVAQLPSPSGCKQAGAEAGWRSSAFPLSGALLRRLPYHRALQPGATDATSAALHPACVATARRFAAGSLPILFCFMGITLRGSLALHRPEAAHSRPALLALQVKLDALCTLAFVATTATMATAATPTACARAARLAAALHALPPLYFVLSGLRLSPHENCPLAPPGDSAACADEFFRVCLAPVALISALLVGLPVRLLFGAEVVRAAIVTATATALARSDGSGSLVWCLGFAAKNAGVAAALPVLLRAAALKEAVAEPEELAALELCPKRLRSTRDALLAAGDAAARAAPWLGSASLAVFAALLTYFVSWFAQIMLARGGAEDDPGARSVVAAWAALFAGALLFSWRLGHTRATNASRSLVRKRVHALHLRLARCDGDPDAMLSAAADFLASVLPPGCSVSLVEWRLVAGSGASASANAGLSFESAAVAALAAAGGQPVRLRVRRCATRAARPAAAPALARAAERACTPGGSMHAALAHTACRGGFILRGHTTAFQDWADIRDAAGAGTVTLVVLGSGFDLTGGMWVHTPSRVRTPDPEKLSDCAECIGASLLRSRAARALLRSSVASAAINARADADATLALQRAFMSGVTHELRTPLNAIIGFNATLLEEAGAVLEPHQSDYLRCGLSAAQSLLLMINQLLEFAAYEHAALHGGKPQPLARNPLSLRDVLDALVDVVGGKAVTSGVGLHVEVDAALQAARLRGDALKLRQVLINLTDNGLKYTTQGHVSVECMAVPPPADCEDVQEDAEQCGRQQQQHEDAEHWNASASPRGAPPPGRSSAATMRLDRISSCSSGAASETEADEQQQWACITIADTGVGIAAHEQWRLFRPFSQVPHAGGGGAKPAGTGLGLVVCKSIVEQMGGRISFTSAIGAGTTFTIFVPFSLAPTASTPPTPGSGRVSEHQSDDLTSLLGVALLTSLPDAALAGALLRQASTWGAFCHGNGSGSGNANLAGASAEELVRAAVKAVALGSRVALLLVDAPTLEALHAPDAAPLPPHVACVLAAPPAECSAWRTAAAAAAGRAPPAAVLALPASPGRLLARLRAAVAAAGAQPGSPLPLRQGSSLDIAPIAPPPLLSAMRVMLAEDNTMNVKIATAVLRRCGVSDLHVVGDGAAAVAAVRDAASTGRCFDLFFCDMEMPVLSGPDAVRAIRRLELDAGVAHGRGVWIVGLTANAAEESCRECMAAGMDDFLTKPFTPGCMRAVLQRHAAARGGDDKPAAAAEASSAAA